MTANRRAEPRRPGGRRRGRGAPGPWVALAGLLLAAGCVRLSVPEPAVAALERGEVDGHRIVFVVEGMVKDLGSDWEERLALDLVADGRLPIVVRYWSDPTGVWFDWGRVAPGRAIAAAADALVDLHVRSGSTRPLDLDVVGFSAGCEALLGAFERAERARFDRAVLVSSSSFFLSTEIVRRLDDGRVADVVAFWSPIDLTTILAPLGAGQFGMRARSPSVRNERLFVPHSARFLGEEELRRFRDALGPVPPPAPPDRFDAALARFLRDASGDGGIEFDRVPREDRPAGGAVPSPP